MSIPADTVTSIEEPPLEEPPDTIGGLTVRLTPHLRNLAKTSPAVARQFTPSPEELAPAPVSFSDPLLEDSHSPVKGLVHKYPGRILITLTMTCAAYCRFCTRRRSVSDLEKGRLNTKDVSNILSYLKTHPDVTEVIFSGGDPVTAPQLLISLLNQISRLKSVRVLRIHSRTPVSSPDLVTPALLSAIKKLSQPLYFSIHFEHPDELTPKTISVVNQLRRAGAVLMSQSVFLKGVNDDYQVLKTLFTRLIELGIRPYYIYHCDPTTGVTHFMVPLKKEVEIMTRLRTNLSGLAFPTHVIDTPDGTGKIPVPMDFWQFNPDSYRDFKLSPHQVINP